MIDKLKGQLINDSSLELTPFQIDYLVKELDKIDVWFEVARNEVITSIDDIYNDELYNDYKEKLGNLSESDINRIAWKVCDEDVWEDVYDVAKDEIKNEIGVYENDD